MDSLHLSASFAITDPDQDDSVARHESRANCFVAKKKKLFKSCPGPFVFSPGRRRGRARLASPCGREGG